LDSWGMNIVRLGVLWVGVEPKRQQFDDHYLDEIIKLVRLLATKNISVIVDAHQDLLSRKFCGEGAADWASLNKSTSLRFPLPLLDKIRFDPETGYPLLADCLKHNFGTFYFAAQTCAAFEALYKNEQNIQDEFVAYWHHVVQRLRSEPNIIGYEIINEPFAGDIYKDPLLLINGKADRVNLQPLYDRVARVMHEDDPQRLVFFEKNVANIGKAGFTHIPVGPEYADRSVFAYHIYCVLVNRSGDPSWIWACDKLDDSAFAGNIKEVKKLGCGGMLTEWGNMGNGDKDMKVIDNMGKYADKYFASWAYWQFKSFHDITTAGKGSVESFYDDDGNVQLPKVKHVARTYAYAIAGNPQSMEFDPNDGYFTLIYYVNTSIKAPTEIYVNTRYYYPNGYTVHIAPAELATYEVIDQYHIRIIHTSAAYDGAQLTVYIGGK